ncbi:MAG: neutral/alkaline non-lysosomal ceramidase N-terminal domain-containing protein, partial [Promethearchaeota archaeon]
MTKIKPKLVMILVVVGLVITIFPISTLACRSKSKLMAGACALPITPMTDEFGIPKNPDGSPIFLAGFGDPGERPAQAVHDDIYARCLILEYNGKTIVFVALDLIGYMIDQVEIVRGIVEINYGIDADNVIIACTHTHSGPDTLGLWTPPYPVPGVNWEYMEYVANQIIECIDQAYQNME